MLLIKYHVTEMPINSTNTELPKHKVTAQGEGAFKECIEFTNLPDKVKELEKQVERLNKDRKRSDEIISSLRKQAQDYEIINKRKMKKIEWYLVGKHGKQYVIKNDKTKKLIITTSEQKVNEKVGEF